MNQILKRKLLSAYFQSIGVLIFFEVSAGFPTKANPNSFENVIGWLVLMLLYIVPVLFIYGIGVSSLIEYLFGKWRIPKLFNIVFSLLLHLMFGSVLGVVSQHFNAGIFGAACAGTFYILDRLIFYFWSKKRRWNVSVGLLPIIAFGGIMFYFYMITPPLPPFTAEEAVQFATSGKGTIIDNYPKEVGKSSLVINGYDIERETAVKEIKKEQYEVSFIERWTKDGQTGEWVSNYIVSRSSMGANGGGGDERPFTNIFLDDVKRAFKAEKLHFTEQPVPSEPKKSIVYNHMAPTSIYKMDDGRFISIYVYDSFDEMEKGLSEFNEEKSKDLTFGLKESADTARNVLFLYTLITDEEQHAIKNLK